MFLPWKRANTERKDAVTNRTLKTIFESNDVTMWTISYKITRENVRNTKPSHVDVKK
jgi:hypothetical protein